MRIILALVLLTVALIALSAFYRTHWHEERQRAEQAIEKFEVLQRSLEEIQRQQKAVAEIDKHYTQELAKANEEIENLRADLVTGRKRLYVKAECPKLPEDSSSPSVGNATAPRLERDAEQNYILLQEQVTHMQKQLEELQEYTNKFKNSPF